MRLPALLALYFVTAVVAAASPHGSPGQAHAEKVVDGLMNPWAIAFLPDGDWLVTERPGRVRLVRDGKLMPEPVSGVPAVAAVGQGGLLDIALHPDFAKQPWVYLTYSAPGPGGQGTAVGRGCWNGEALTQWETLFELPRKTGKGHHFGSRIAFDEKGYLYVSAGDRGDRDRAQDLTDPAGSIWRLHDDGRIPEDNPFSNASAPSPIWSVGHRNPQGLIRHPLTGEIWAHEHGPQGGDELNRIQRGANYGWPVISYGREYGTSFAIGDGYSKAGLEQPTHYWVPSIAPSGMSFYDADRFPQWRNNLFIGSLKFQYLARLIVDTQGRVIREERLLENDIGRIRDVRTAPDGYLYVLTDSGNGGIYRVSP